MSVNLLNQYVLQFSTNLQLLLQQRGSKLRPWVMEMSCYGEQSSPVDQIASVEASVVADRFAPMPRTDAAVDRRWLVPTDLDLNQMIDTFDKLRLLNDPMGQYTVNATYALGRQIDDLIISAFFGTARTGKQGGTSTAFAATLTTSGGQNVAVAQGAASATNLTVAKLREGKRQLMANQVDLDNDPLLCGVKAKEHDSLLAEAQVISTDFNNEGGRPVLKDGRINRFLGIDFVYCERFTTGTDDAAGTSTQTPLWAKSGMYLGIWNDIYTRASQRNDIRGEPWQVYARITAGSTRIEEKKVVRIWTR